MLNRRGRLTSGAIDVLFASLAHAKRVLLAVSGGPDSTALTLMAASWSLQPGRPNVEVATVDHAMRAEARAEVDAVADLCRRLDLPHHVLEWRGARPKSRIQELAREARYRLLIDCAGAIGADCLVTAHHADDQAETVLFRLLRGSGIAGLAGMPQSAVRDGVALVRPLLSLSKADLVAYCREHGEAFARDPTNDDPRFARTNLRKLTTILAKEGLGATEFARLARRAASMEDAVRRATEAASARLAWPVGGPCDARALFAEPLEVAQRLIAARVHEIGGRAGRPIRLDQIEALAMTLKDALERNATHRANIGGSDIALSRLGRLTIKPESPRRKIAAKRDVKTAVRTIK